MKRALRLAWVALATQLLACAGVPEHVPEHAPPGPQPMPKSWRPRDALREHVPLAARAEVVLNDRDGLSPDEAAIMAVDQNPRLRALRAERGVARAELIAAGVLPNPRLDASIDPIWYGPEAAVLGYGVGLSWNVTPLLSRGARVGAAQEGLASVDLEIAWQEWQVAQAARLHAVRAIYLERRVAVARELEETWRQRIEGLQQARVAGAITAMEVTTAARAYAEARVASLELAQRLVIERAELSSAIGIDPTAELALDASYAPPQQPALDENALDQLPKKRLDLIALQHAHRSRDERVRAAVIAQFPPIELGFQTRREVDQNASVGVTLSVEMPFFDRNQAAIARGHASRTQIEAEYAARLLAARTDTLRTLRELHLVHQQLAFAREAAEHSTRLADQAQAATVAGALTSLLAADALQRAYANRLRTLEVEQLLAELHIALAVASGTDVR